MRGIPTEKHRCCPPVLTSIGRTPTSSSSPSLLLLIHLLFFLYSLLSPLAVCPVIHAAMQSSLLCRQNCRDSHLPFPFLVLTIHLTMSCGAELASSLLSACCRTHLLRTYALTLLITCLHVHINWFFLCLISTPPSLSFCLSFSVVITLQMSWRLQVCCQQKLGFHINPPTGF